MGVDRRHHRSRRIYHHVDSRRSVSSWWMHCFLIGEFGTGIVRYITFQNVTFQEVYHLKRIDGGSLPCIRLIMAPKTNRHRTWEWRCAIYFHYRVIWGNFHLGAEKNRCWHGLLLDGFGRQITQHDTWMAVLFDALILLSGVRLGCHHPLELKDRLKRVKE